jgi:glycosyltransferase involved in cell wall biosynthesis
MKISIIIPAHNEEKNIENAVKNVCRELQGLDFEIILVDDNSTDRTGKIVDKLAGNNIKVIHRAPPNGFGLALRDGFKAATGDVIIPVMADLSDDPKDIKKMVRKIEQGYDVVLGSRFISGSEIEGYPKLKLILNRLFNHVCGFLFQLPFKDVSNAFKACRKNVLKSMKLESAGFEITAEIPLKARVSGYKLTEVPVHWHGRRGGVSKMRFLVVGPRYCKVLISHWFKFLNGKFLR